MCWFGLWFDVPVNSHGGYHTIRENPQQFENQIMAQVYVSSITRSTIYQNFVSPNWCMEN